MSTLVILTSLCGNAPEYDVQYVRERWYNEHATAETLKDGTFEDLVGQCSFGKWAFEPQDNIVVPTVVPVGCSGNGSQVAKPCTPAARDGFAESAISYVRQNTDIEPNDFTHKILILPLRTSDCGMNALGAQNCAELRRADCYVWSFGEYRPRELMHEVGHNLGLFHSRAGRDKYGDAGSLMGAGPSPVCWNAPQGQALGLDAPIATITADTLPPGSWQTLRLPPAYVTETNFVAVQPSWMADPLQRRGTLYLTYRLARGEEAGLSKDLDGRIHIHFYVGNMSLSNRNYTLLLGNITEGSQWPPAALAGSARYPWRLLVVAASTPRNTSSVAGMIATAQVCRFNFKPDECGTPPPATVSSVFTTRSWAAAAAAASSASVLVDNTEAADAGVDGALGAAAGASPPEAGQADRGLLTRLRSLLWRGASA